jgi:hypothetical protein
MGELIMVQPSIMVLPRAVATLGVAGSVAVMGTMGLHRALPARGLQSETGLSVSVVSDWPW